MTFERPRLPARLLRDGDLIDLDELPYPVSYADNPSAEFEFARVGSEDGPITAETSGCVVVHTDQGSYGVPPDHQFTLIQRTQRGAGWVVVDGDHADTPILGRFDTEDEGSAFIGGLPGAEGGRYGLDPLSFGPG